MIVQIMESLPRKSQEDEGIFITSNKPQDILPETASNTRCKSQFFSSFFYGVRNIYARDIQVHDPHPQLSLGCKWPLWHIKIEKKGLSLHFLAINLIIYIYPALLELVYLISTMLVSPPFIISWTYCQLSINLFFDSLNTSGTHQPCREG